MSKERLEEAKKLIDDYRNCYHDGESLEIARTFVKKHAFHLIEQAETLEKCAERNKELEEENKALHNGMKMLDRICDRKDERLMLSESRENREREQNKRMREQLKLIISDTHCKEHEYVSVRHLIRKRAEKTLEETKNE